jgi:REP element-mobilizing transposase RayT
MGHTYSRLLTHVVFSTKNRVPSIDKPTGPRLFAYMGGIVRELSGTALIVNGLSDHVHLLVCLPPTLAISDFNRVLKTNSSKWFHDEFPVNRDFGWQTGYGAFSVSESNIPTVQKYIANQEEHHQSMTFQEEFLALLKRHGIEYDERYVWE